MSTDSKLRTGWICIATEGNSVDGRYITREWIQDMAETYDPDFYCAVIWPEHERWSAMGTVEAAKAEEVDGKLKLYAVIRPTRDLIYNNQIGQKQFCSIEPEDNFAGTGRTYLGGLGVTDQPASTGLTRLQFNSNKPTQKMIGKSERFSLADLADPEQEAGMFKKFMTWFKAQEPETPAPTTSAPEEPMDKEQFSELLTAVKSVADKQGELETKFEQFSKQEPEPAPAAAPKAEPETAPAPAAGITGEQFSELLTTVKGMAIKQGELENQFSTLLKEKPGQTPNPAPAGGDIYHVV